MTREFDLVVLGTGGAGSVAARQCKRAGWEVAVIDSRPFGGTCALRGCDPKKVLVGVADVMDWLRRMQDYGISSSELRLQWQDLMRFKRTFTDSVPENREQSFARAGIAAFHGPARFVDSTTVQVGSDTLKGRHVLIATGARPAPLHIPGEEHVTLSDGFLEMEQLPPRIVFIGGGYISFEFAHIVARAGVRPTILHRGPRPLVRFDPDLVDRLVSASREVGIDVQLDTQVEGIESIASGLIVATSIKGHKRKFEADLVVHGGGRVPNIDSLDLKAAAVRYDPRGVIVNEFFQSVSNPVVYATGDCANSGPPLTPVAGRESKIAAENMLKGNHATLDYTGVSSVVFTIPPLASVGLQEDEARKQNLDFEVKQADTAGWYASRRVNEKHSAYKVLVEKNSGRILGAHLLGNHTDELINLFALAIRFDLRSDDLKDLMYAYPTHGSNIPYMV